MAKHEYSPGFIDWANEPGSFSKKYHHYTEYGPRYSVATTPLMPGMDDPRNYGPTTRVYTTLQVKGDAPHFTPDDVKQYKKDAGRSGRWLTGIGVTLCALSIAAFLSFAVVPQFFLPFSLLGGLSLALIGLCFAIPGHSILSDVHKKVSAMKEFLNSPQFRKTTPSDSASIANGLGADLTKQPSPKVGQEIGNLPTAVNPTHKNLYPSLPSSRGLHHG